ncbi:hypothetical protein PF005_g6675 [Phytophthora fragariae]|uniref:Uncharacterized protein n=1 Tax=Phytophthora fragariae TaxID=53985 RepID=A0A6A3T244_9STRA|nr:hypothetical protein PF009_g3374 [Phytophthora fragariae]KAE9127995.1 hypothetical protein PF007_g5419 [Phytophthora fragariae]KAE9147914.1 hypothetical protein PF006_g7457 [Phytophthora fragariae]KAE9222493.1 hypothetical protein PF005_g6675 [Phytophthora fragariae]
MTWAAEGVTDLRDFVAACAPFGGPAERPQEAGQSGVGLPRQRLLFNACATFSMAGDEETRFSLLPPGSKDKVATFEPWGSGLVALMEKMALVQVLDVDSVRPKVSLLSDCGLSDANPPTCMSVLEPKFLKSIYPEVLLGSSNRSLVVVSKGGGAHDMKLQDSIDAPNGLFMALFSQNGILTVLNTMMDKKRRSCPSTR